LASVQHLVRKDPPRADFLLSQLIRYLREAMPDFRGMGSTLGREFGLAEAYLNIVKIRLDGRLEIKVNIAHELADTSFPVLIVQTLVENAIKHGIEPKPGPVHIDVTASETTVEGKKFIDVSVSDDGVGFGAADTMGTGVGLRNIRERLAGLYDSSASLSIAEVQPSGVCATVRIPRTMA
jgi:LytS/YehU family sensor histidine kinase